MLIVESHPKHSRVAPIDSLGHAFRYIPGLGPIRSSSAHALDFLTIKSCSELSWTCLLTFPLLAMTWSGSQFTLHWHVFGFGLVQMKTYTVGRLLQVFKKPCGLSNTVGEQSQKNNMGNFREIAPRGWKSNFGQSTLFLLFLIVKTMN